MPKAMEHDADVHARLISLGKCFELERKRRGWSDRQAVRIVGSGFTRSQLYRIESGDPARSVAYQRYAKALGMRVELVPDKARALGSDPAPKVGSSGLASNVLAFTLGQGEDMDRRELIASVAALLLDGALPQVVKALFASPRCPFGTVTEVEDLGEECASYLLKHEAHAGAGATLGAAMSMYSQACAWRDAGAVEPKVSRALAVLCCDLGAWTGRAAFIANHHGAEAYLQETLARAHMLGHAEIETRIMDVWAMSRGSAARPTEALDAALRGIERAPFQKAQAKLHLQAARYCAVLKDREGFSGHVQQAEELLAAHASTSARWLENVTTGMYWIGHGHLALGHTEAAIAAFQATAADTRSNYRSDVIGAKILTARAHAEGGDVAVGAEMGLAMLPEAQSVASHVMRDLRRLIATVRATGQSSEARLFLAACDEWLAA